MPALNARAFVLLSDGRTERNACSTTHTEAALSSGSGRPARSSLRTLTRSFAQASNTDTQRVSGQHHDRCQGSGSYCCCQRRRRHGSQRLWMRAAADGGDPCASCIRSFGCLLVCACAAEIQSSAVAARQRSAGNGRRALSHTHAQVDSHSGDIACTERAVTVQSTRALMSHSHSIRAVNDTGMSSLCELDMVQDGPQDCVPRATRCIHRMRSLELACDLPSTLTHTRADGRVRHPRVLRWQVQAWIPGKSLPNSDRYSRLTQVQLDLDLS